jgi:hypothetical protein
MRPEHRFADAIEQLALHDTVHFPALTCERILIARTGREARALVAAAGPWSAISVSRPEWKKYIIRLTRPLAADECDGLPPSA